MAVGGFGCRYGEGGGGASQPKPHPAAPHRTHRCRNSWKRMRLGKPWRQMRMPSRTPLQRSWSSTSRGSSLPACREQGRHTVLAAATWGRLAPDGSRLGKPGLALPAGQKSLAISHGSTYNFLSTYCPPGRDACPGGVHCPAAEADNEDKKLVTKST